MLDNNAIKEILLKPVISDIEGLQVIERFIYDKKGFDIKINRPDNQMSLMLYKVAEDTAFEYYGKKLLGNEG